MPTINKEEVHVGLTSFIIIISSSITSKCLGKLKLKKLPDTQLSALLDIKSFKLTARLVLRTIMSHKLYAR